MESKTIEKKTRFDSIEAVWNAQSLKCPVLKSILNDKRLLGYDLSENDVVGECILGAVLAQETIKNLTKRTLPVKGLFTLDSETIAAVIYS